jgi:type IV secretion system protein VirB8
MKKTARESLDAYYRGADSWANDRQDGLRKSRRIAWIVAGAAGAIAIFEASALMFLAPLKTVVPYTLMVDRHTGYVQALKPIDAQQIAPDAALTQSFLVQYVVARESFDIDELQANYRKVSLWSADAAKSDYVTSVQVSTPGSPLSRYPRSTVVDTSVKSVSPLGGNAALVRFETQRREASGQAQPARAWVAVIRYRFSTEPLQMEDRFINPLGFQVVRYRRDAEALPPPAPVEAPLGGTQPATTSPPAGGPAAGVPQGAPPRPPAQQSQNIEVTL